MRGLSPALVESADHTDAISPDDPAIGGGREQARAPMDRTVASCTPKRLAS
jgi:hypothetical protein